MKEFEESESLQNVHPIDNEIDALDREEEEHSSNQNALLSRWGVAAFMQTRLA